MFSIIKLLQFLLLIILLIINLTNQTTLSSDQQNISTNSNNLVINPLQSNENINYRLPNVTKPEHYEINYVTRIDEGNFEFSGSVKIDIIIVNTTNEITLHQRQLTITSTLLFNENNVLTYNCTFQYDNETEFLRILSPVTLVSAEKYKLEILFTGILRTDNKGFYRSSYRNKYDEQIWLATTQYSQTEARHGFPCYDEPGIKATFAIQITHHNTYTAISNMPVKEQFDSGSDLVTTVFETTPVMSTFLIAYIISDFEHVSRQVDDQFEFRSFARPNAIHLTNLSLTEGPRVLQALNNYMGIEFSKSVPKMDQVAIPDFFYSAMENWGLVTYREVRFLFDDETSIYTLKTAIVNVIGHEFTHQWFGNLVSPVWWSYVWLKEGFATLFSYLITDTIYPEWNYLDHFVVHVKQSVLIRDSEPSSRQMSLYVDSPTAVSALFDFIAYNKSSCVLRMIQESITPQTFQKGLFYYLTNNSYDSATENTLFEALDEAVKEDGILPIDFNIETIMSSWTRQIGYPVLSVNRDYEDGSITLTQQRHITYETNETDETLWWIPCNFVVARNSNFSTTTPHTWMYERTMKIDQTTSGQWSNDDWIVFNVQSTGYYRVQYDVTNWNLIITTLQYGDHNVIHKLNRAQLIDDAYTFAKSNQLNWTIVLDLTRYLYKETEFAPWQSAANAITYLNRYLVGSNSYDLFKRYIVNATNNLITTVGVVQNADEPFARKYLRTIAIDLACTMDSDICRDMILDAFLENWNKSMEIHQNYKYQYYCNVFRYGYDESTNNARFTQPNLMFFNEWFFRKMLIENDATERNDIALALGCLRNPDVIENHLEYIINSDNSQYTLTDKIRVFNAFYQYNHIGLDYVLEFYQRNSSDLYRLFGANNFRNILNSISERIVNENHQNKYKSILDLAVESGQITAEQRTQAMDRTMDNLNWMNVYGKDVENWLTTVYNSGNRHYQMLQIISFVLSMIVFKSIFI